MKKSLFSRVKASVVSMALAATAVPACLATPVVNAEINPDTDLSAPKTVGKSMSVDDSASGTLPEDGAKQITFTIETEYDQKFTYGLGISTNESPYWTEHNSKGGWDSKGSGFEISLKKGTNTITVDLSDIDVKPGGEYQFRCYYSAHYDNSVGDMVDNPVTLTKTDFNASTVTPDPDPDPDPDPNPGPSFDAKNRKSGEWSFKDNEDGTATISSTVTRELNDLDILLTKGFDEDYYALHPDEFTEDAPINSHKFRYADFGITEMSGITIESLNVTVESETPFDKFMYGGGMNVKSGSDADTEYAKRIAGIEGKESAGYWYNDMGQEQLDDLIAQGVKFLIDDIGTGTTIEGAGTYINAYWEPPKSVQKCMSTQLTDAVSFQFWYGTVADTEEYTEAETCTITSAALTYTIERTVPYTGTLSAVTDTVLDYTDETKQSVEIPYSTLELEKDMDVYAIKFEVTADADIEKFVYGIGTGTNDADNGYYFQEEGSYVVLEAGKKQEVMWIVPSSISGTNAVSNLVNPDGNITVGYYYGTPDTVTLSNIEVYYEQPQTTTTTTTTTTTSKTTTTTTTTTSKPKTTTTTTTSTTTTTTTTTTTAPIEPTVWGDADCDGKVFLNDAVLVMQCIGNPDVYGINGTDPSHITKQGKINADVYENGTDLTNNDALMIQKFLINLIASLDPFAES